MGLILYKLALKTFSIKAKHDKGLFETCLLKHVYFVGLLKAFGLLGTISLHHAHHKRAKATTSRAYKRAPLWDYAVSSPYQAIAFYDYPLIEKFCLEAVYLAQLTKLRAIQEHLPSTLKYDVWAALKTKAIVA